MLKLSQLTLALAFVCLSIGTASAQLPVPFWTEDFSNGLPAGWATTDGSNQNILWTWCPNPLLGDSDPGCSEPWDDPLNAQTPFRATTANTGFMVLDSDDPGNLPANHVSRLTTPAVNCTGKDQVFVLFQTHIGVYSLGAEANAILRVSTNGTTWTNYTIFPGLSTTVRWSDNPEIPIIDISATAANQANVQIQWQWTGNWEYMWSLDDIEIYDVNPTPRNDASISAFFYPVSSFATPASQISTDTFQFEVNLSNKGLNPQTNLVITAFVEEDGGSVLHTQTVNVPLLDVGETDVSVLFPDLFVPTLDPGLYRIGYTLISDSIDQRPLDNERASQFVVSNNVFAKENGPEQGYRPSAGGDWAVANYYRMSGGNFEQYKATLAEFAFSTNSDELPIGAVESTIYLLKISDDVAEDFSNFDGAGFGTTSLDFVGIASYEAPDTIGNYQLQQVQITDFNTSEDGVLLQTGGRYLLVVELRRAELQGFSRFQR